jgi:hypothetical protein
MASKNRFHRADLDEGSHVAKVEDGPKEFRALEHAAPRRPLVQ